MITAAGTEASSFSSLTRAKLLELECRMKDPERGLKIADRWFRLRKHSNCFIASEAVDWLTSNFDSLGLSTNLNNNNNNRETAVKLFRFLQEGNVIYNVLEKEEPFDDRPQLHFRFTSPTEEKGSPLNFRKVYTFDSVQHPSDLSVLLLYTVLSLVENKNEEKEDKKAENGGEKEKEKNEAEEEKRRKRRIEANRIHFVEECKRIKNSEKFTDFLLTSSELHRVSLDELKSDAEKLAFWINIYNTLVMHSCIVNGPPQGPVQRKAFFTKSCYNVASYVFTLDDIEHSILRGASEKRASKLFKENDPRKAFTLQTLEPRLHFLLSCCTVGSPPIAALDQFGVEEHLHRATYSFLSDHVKLELSKTLIVLPKVFDWYQNDFGGTNFDVIKWAFQYLTRQQKRTLNSMSEMGYVSIKYLNYDWTPSFPQSLTIPEETHTNKNKEEGAEVEESRQPEEEENVEQIPASATPELMLRRQPTFPSSEGKTNSSELTSAETEEYEEYEELDEEDFAEEYEEEVEVANGYLLGQPEIDSDGVGVGEDDQVLSIFRKF
ncbi:Ternary complex factor MIP1 leucine-zipper protein [Balamuthia mandrillaris]